MSLKFVSSLDTQATTLNLAARPTKRESLAECL
jgi:hypothetical protein